MAIPVSAGLLRCLLGLAIPEQNAEFSLPVREAANNLGTLHQESLH